MYDDFKPYNNMSMQSDRRGESVRGEHVLGGCCPGGVCPGGRCPVLQSSRSCDDVDIDSQFPLWLVAQL